MWRRPWRVAAAVVVPLGVVAVVVAATHGSPGSEPAAAAKQAAATRVTKRVEGRRLAAAKRPAGRASRHRRRARASVYAAPATGKLSSAVRGLEPRVYVPNSEAGTLDVIDPHSGRIVAHYGVGALPHHVTPSWDLKHLYVDNTSGNSLTVINPRSGRPVKTIPEVIK